MSNWPGPVTAITLFVDDPEACREFYTGIFGLPVVYQDEVSVVFDFSGLLVNLLRVSEAPELIAPASVGEQSDGSRFQFTIEVEDVDAVGSLLAQTGSQSSQWTHGPSLGCSHGCVCRSSRLHLGSRRSQQVIKRVPFPVCFWRLAPLNRPQQPRHSPSAPTTTLALGQTTLPATTTEPSTTAAPTTTTLAPLQALELVTVAEGLTQPVLLLSPPGETTRLVLERTGLISTLNDDGSVAAEPFLDLRDRVNSGGIEQGLLGMAFHPNYQENGRLFVYYYRQGAEQTQLSEFAAIDGFGDPTSEQLMITFDKPTVRHNGGMLLFGPDGYLWMSLGEGGKASVNSQDPFRLLSSILRLDVDNGEPYGTPPDNPYVDGTGAPEVWAKGLRNPWRFTIDDDLIYIADVGHSDYEEINIVSLDGAPYNFGWLRMEGTHCFQSGCDPVAENLTLPVHEYTHAEGCSITGGPVYRGSLIPELDGHYLYADWCGGWVRSFRFDQGELLEHQTRFEEAGQVNSFGLDSAGEVYLLTYEGEVKKIVAVR